MGDRIRIKRLTVASDKRTTIFWILEFPAIMIYFNYECNMSAIVSYIQWLELTPLRTKSCW